MCGICGSVGASVSVGRLHAATRLMRHRGPDEEGFYRTDSVALGMRRLKVIDLAGGTQPKTNETESVHIVFNGEIYNYRELRTELRSAGHEFRSESDTEVVVHAYEEWGTAACKRLNGIFAFALWDEAANSLVLARDHVGIKPLYYSVNNGRITFGSELKPLIALLPEVPGIDTQSFLLYLRFGYVPSPHSIVSGTKKLPPGHVLTFDATSGTSRVEQYWNPLEFARNKRRLGDPVEAENLVETGLREAVKRQLVSDVPVGAFLSGGIDSSLVVSMMADVSEQTPKTFSIGFNEKAVDESVYAQKVAAHLGTDHYARILTSSEALEVLPRLPHFFDEPFADPSSIPTYLVSGLAREQVTVSLSGDGGDELFGGYNRYGFLLRTRNIWRVPASLRKLAVRSGRHLPGRIGNNFRVHGSILSTSALDVVYRTMMTQIDDRDIDAFTNSTGSSVSISDWPSANFEQFSLIEAMMLTDLVTYLPDDILTKVDRASMAWSLESRVPLLDRELAEFVLSIPVELRTAGELKGLLKRILRRKVPAELVDRPKQGFGIPIHEWLRSDLYESLSDHLSGSAIERHGLLVAEPIRQMIDEHHRGWSDHGYALWTLYMFQMWYESFYSVTLAERTAAS